VKRRGRMWDRRQRRWVRCDCGNVCCSRTLVLRGHHYHEVTLYRHKSVAVAGCDHRDFGRRSDAKRWLLARAAGLAEVPRRVRVGPRGGSWSYVRRDAHTVWPPPGWHEVEEYIGDDGEVGVVLCERNRRRR